MNKKGKEGLSLNVIIVAILALIVLVVLVCIFTGRINVFEPEVYEPAEELNLSESLINESVLKKEPICSSAEFEFYLYSYEEQDLIDLCYDSDNCNSGLLKIYQEYITNITITKEFQEFECQILCTEGEDCFTRTSTCRTYFTDCILINKYEDEADTFYFHNQCEKKINFVVDIIECH